MARRKRDGATAGEFAEEKPTRPKASAFAEIAAKSKAFRPAREVLRVVRSVPTIFPALDRVLRVGGWPIDRLATIHGPSGKGKTFLANGLGYSFLQRGHMFALIDAEHTTPISWLEQLFGAYADDPRFVAARPESYEQAVDSVEQLAEGVAASREAGDVPPDTTCLFVVDSLDALTPQDVLAAMKKAAESKDGSVDGMKGAAGMVQAAYNKAWTNRLVPIMSRTGCAIAFVLREAEDRNASARDRQFGNDWRTTGGRHVYFNSSVDIRVDKATMIHADPESRSSPVLGERHRVQVHKTKVSARQDYVEEAYFSTSNGAWAPEGFDRARDLLDLGLELGVVERKRGWISYGRRRWQGEERFFAAAPELLGELEASVRAAFAADLAKTKAEVVGG